MPRAMAQFFDAIDDRHAAMIGAAGIISADDAAKIDAGLAQIADEVGLGDASYLGKCVRRRFGCTALQLRAGHYPLT